MVCHRIIWLNWYARSASTTTIMCAKRRRPRSQASLSVKNCAQTAKPIPFIKKQKCNQERPSVGLFFLRQMTYYGEAWALSLVVEQRSPKPLVRVRFLQRPQKIALSVLGYRAIQKHPLQCGCFCR